MDMLSFMDNPNPLVFHQLPFLTLDLETTNLDFGDPLNPDNDIILTSYIWDGIVHSVFADELHYPSHVLDLLEGEAILLAQNVKFELQWLARAGLDISKVLVYDTMLAEKVLLGNNPKKLSLSLDAIAQRRGFKGKEPVVNSMINMGVCPSDIPPSLLKRRCEYDVRTTYAVMQQQLQELTEQGKLGVLLTRCILTPVLADIETNGLNLDAERVYDLYEDVAAKYADVSIELSKLRDINWNSPQQKAHALYEVYKFKELKRYGKPATTPGGQPKTDIDTIKQLTAKTKIQKKVKQLLLKQSDLNAKLTKALNKFKSCVDSKDILHAVFRQDVTVTHRLSSTGKKYKAQLQNIARELKPLFCARHKKWLFGEADGSNLEFRVAIDLARDKQGMIDIVDPEFDAHKRTAQKLTEGGQETERQDAKAHTFKPLYGGSSGTDAEKAYYESFKERYKDIAALQDKWLDEAYKNKSVKLPWGMEFFYPNTKFTRTGFQIDSTNICNYPVQSFATADIVPIALVYTWLQFKNKKLRAFLVNTVHDSIEWEAPPEEGEIIDEIVRNAFTKVCYNYLYKVYNYHFITPLGVGIKWGTHWGEGEEIKEDIPNTFEYLDYTLEVRDD